MKILLIVAAMLGTASLSAQHGWRLENGSAPFTPRGLHASAAFNGSMHIINGGGGTYVGDSWSSTNGVSWTLTSSQTPWPAKLSSNVAVFNNRLWSLGGHNGAYQNDVWSSPDGVNWTLETASAPWSGRTGFGCEVFDNRIWVFGGLTLQPPNYHHLSDVWSSPDGVNWTQEVAAANWSARDGFTSAVFASRLWVMGGYDGQVKSDVWSTTDGVNWVQEISDAPWGPRESHCRAVLNGRIWILAGSRPGVPSNQFLNDVWSSVDGVTWALETSSAPWDARIWASTVTMNGRIWLLGGTTPTQYLSEVWSLGFYLRHSLPNGLLHVPYSADVEARAGVGPYQWSLTGGSLPPGLTIDTSTTGHNASIIGTPTEAGTFTFTMRADDQGTGDWVEETLTLTITPPQPPKLAGSNGASCQAAPNQSGKGARGTSTAVLWLTWLTALTVATITLRSHGRS